MFLIKTWPGVIDPAMLHESHVEQASQLADAAKAGKWDEMFGMLDSDTRLSANQWRIGGESWYAPLHHAAWNGAPVGVVGGSGQSHVISENGCVLVAEGFV